MTDDYAFISENIPYEKVREYLLEQGVAKPGKGMKQMIDTIKDSGDSDRYVSELKKVYALMSSADKKVAKKKAGQRKETGPGFGPGFKKRQKNASSSVATIIDDDDDGEEDDDQDSTMQRLKEFLALRGKTTIGNSYPRLVKRLLDALEEEAEESDDD